MTRPVKLGRPQQRKRPLKKPRLSRMGGYIDPTRSTQSSLQAKLSGGSTEIGCAIGDCPWVSDHTEGDFATALAQMHAHYLASHPGLRWLSQAAINHIRTIWKA